MKLILVDDDGHEYLVSDRIGARDLTNMSDVVETSVEIEEVMRAVTTSRGLRERRPFLTVLPSPETA